MHVQIQGFFLNERDSEAIQLDELENLRPSGLPDPGDC